MMPELGAEHGEVLEAGAAALQGSVVLCLPPSATNFQL